VRGCRVGLLVAAVVLGTAASGCDRSHYRESVDAPPSALTALRFTAKGDPQVWIATCGVALRHPVTLNYAPVDGRDSTVWQFQIDASKLPSDTKSVVLSPTDIASAYESTTTAFDPSEWSAARAAGAVTVQVTGTEPGHPDASSTYQLSAVTAASPNFLVQDYRHESLKSLNKEARDYCAATAGSTYPP
jgi:hypothetical protein